MPQPAITFTSGQLEEMAARYRAGETSTQLAERFYCSPQTVRDRLHDSGVRLRPKGGSTRKLPLSEIEHMEWLYWGEGYSYADLAREFNIAVRTVRDRFTRYGISARPQYATRAST